MAKTTKICPLNDSPCDPFSQKTDETANLNCTFFISDMFAARCLYIEGMKALPQIADNIKKIKIQN